MDDQAHTAPHATLARKFEALPWKGLATTRTDLERCYLDRSFVLDGVAITFDHETLYRAAVKYGRAIAHTARMYRTLVEKMGDKPFDFEVSVDETETPTSPEEHFFISNELKRLGVKWNSLAPRYIGRFEKGIDYIGDLKQFGADLLRHVAIARALGPYKLSIHSGSDKFRIYPIVNELTDGFVHVKTAGTSYLEALRVVARIVPTLFREILTLAHDRYHTDRVTYQVSAKLNKLPRPGTLSDGELPDLLEHSDRRQVLHVTFGSVLSRAATVRDRLLATLRAHEELYAQLLERRFERHLVPFAEGKERPGEAQ